MFKNLLRDFRLIAQWFLHVILIPVIAVLKSLQSGIAHLVDELGKM